MGDGGCPPDRPGKSTNQSGNINTGENCEGGWSIVSRIECHKAGLYEELIDRAFIQKHRHNTH